MEAFSQLPPTALGLIGFLFGLMVGSFSNVCISRLPEKLSVVSPASRCPSCKTPIRPTDNIPILSYVLLKGKCRSCGIKISWVYPLIELIIGILVGIVCYRFGWSWESLIFSIVMPALVIITVIDIQHQIIPDIITLPGIVFGMIAGTYMNGFVTSLLGFLIGGGIFYLLAEVYFRTRGKMGMGGGDIKYIAAAGALLGWSQVLLIIFMGSFLGAAFGAVGMGVKKLDFLSLIPFGPFLALATLISIFFGNDLIDLYLSVAVVKQ